MKYALIPLGLLVLTGTACKKKESNQCTSGTGGNLTLVLFPQHHGKAIYSRDNYRDTAYIKYNATDAPANSTYDLIIAGEEGEEHVHVPNMKCGNYYILMTGYDTTIQQRVKGGIPYTTTQTTGEVDVNVPVTE